MYAKGDIDPTPWIAEVACESRGPQGQYCTWDADHHDPDQHVAGDISRRVAAVWPVKKEG